MNRATNARSSASRSIGRAASATASTIVDAYVAIAPSMTAKSTPADVANFFQSSIRRYLNLPCLLMRIASSHLCQFHSGIMSADDTS